MVVCKFYEQGTCRYGNNCRFEHPRGGQSSNRFAAFGSNSGGGFNRGGNDSLPYMLSKEMIEKDLTSEAPQWILSAYGPGRDAPEQLFGGSMREQSFEEMRLYHVMATASGNPQQALNQAQELYQQAQQQMTTALGDLDGAIQFIISAESKHPNRIDICKQGTLPGGTTGEFAVGKRATPSLGQQNPFSSGGSSATTANPFSAGSQQSSAFGSGSSSTGSAFGQASALGQKPNPFGTPAFGQPSQPTSAFGQPSSTPAFGQPSQPTSAFGGAAPSQTPAFGQPSQPTSAFGQPSALGGGTSAFGQPSTLGQKSNPFGAPAFGQPAQPSTGSAFGQPSQPGSIGSAFGQPSQPGATGSAFGQPSQPGSAGSAFGQPSQLGATGSAFGQASALGQKPNPFGGGGAASGGPSPFASAGGGNTVSPFGQALNAASSTLGAPSQPSQSAFGQVSQSGASASPFGQPKPAASSPFGQPPQPEPSSSAFGAKPDAQTGGGSMNTQPTSAFGQLAQSQAAANPFQQNKPALGQNTGLGGGAPSANPFGGRPAAPAAQGAAASGGGPYPPGSSRQHPPVSSYSSKGMDGRLSNWKGKPVTYQNNLPGIRGFDGSWTRIWFPDGPPNYYKDTELPDELYDEKSKLQWQAFTQTGKFEGGLMPELPPKREFCLWDL